MKSSSLHLTSMYGHDIMMWKGLKTCDKQNTNFTDPFLSQIFSKEPRHYKEPHLYVAHFALSVVFFHLHPHADTLNTHHMKATKVQPLTFWVVHLSSFLSDTYCQKVFKIGMAWLLWPVASGNMAPPGSPSMGEYCAIHLSSEDPGEACHGATASSAMASRGGGGGGGGCRDFVYPTLQ